MRGEERRRRLMFNWKRYAGFSLICARKCSLSHSLSLSSLLLFPISTPFLLTSFSHPLFCLSKMQSLSVFFLCLSSAFPFFLPPRSLIFSLWSFLSASRLRVAPLPLSMQQWFDAALLSYALVRGYVRFHACMCIGLLSRLSFVWIWHK